MSNEETQSELSILFEQYKVLFTEDKQQKIIARGFAFSEVDFSSNILICGFNPSMRTDFLKSSFSYDYNLVKNSDRYFKKFNSFFDDEKYKLSYFDLFYQKHSKQKEVEAFYKSKLGLEFLQTQLNITKKKLLQLRPKAIFVFNKEAFSFFDYHPKRNIGLNFNLTPYPINNTYYCEEINALIYEARFLNHFIKKGAIQQMKKDINQIMSNL